MSIAVPSSSQEIIYPVSDGKPMAETPLHRRVMTDLIDVLERRYAETAEVYISGNMFVYFEEGNPRRHVSPDVFLVFGVPRRERDAYKTWEEPKPTLDFVVEVTSASTAQEDLWTKRDLYRDRLGVREYVLFDPYAEYLDPSQQLYRLVDGTYEAVKPVDGRLPSEVLGVHLERDDSRLRLWNPATGHWLLTAQERADAAQQRADAAVAERDAVAEQRDQANAERDQAVERWQASESEIERLKQELDRLRGESAGEA